MGNNKQSTGKSDDMVPTYTLAAAFAISLAMGLVVVSGIIFKPYEAKEVVEELHQRILYEKEMRELRRLSYGTQHVNYVPTVVSDSADAGRYYTTDSSYAITPPKPVTMGKKTERAENFEREVRSDDYWAHLQASVRGESMPPSSEPVVIPPVVIGSAD
ncbi:hypothetical protein [Leucothrix pacifica]|uniref:Uncharacterized protein n=1 Tax=Leucothrix pacifica TaxID=1247513 RepID=A0A317CNF4_9GAMM|nr:hypothetical protein [Leucothrix pacifica]PWR00079.1 hypothetical protein DKW60_02775 [Leucothrix pacifica]